MAEPSQATAAPVVANRGQHRLAISRELAKHQSQWTTSCIPAENWEESKSRESSCLV